MCDFMTSFQYAELTPSEEKLSALIASYSSSFYEDSPLKVIRLTQGDLLEINSWSSIHDKGDWSKYNFDIAKQWKQSPKLGMLQEEKTIAIGIKQNTEIMAAIIAKSETSSGLLVVEAIDFNINDIITLSFTAGAVFMILHIFMKSKGLKGIMIKNRSYIVDEFCIRLGYKVDAHNRLIK